MERKALKYLYEWKQREDRKPLVIYGARQVGKTWLMLDFAKKAFTKYVYINFEDEDRLSDLFEKDFDVNRILITISLVKKQEIDKDTLLIFDEIQAVKRGVTSLKYFQEKAPQMYLMAAGSLLGISHHFGDSFPVGKVDSLNLYPLDFSEFLDALGEQKMGEMLSSQSWNVISVVKDKYEKVLREYYYVGGMPAVVDSFIHNHNFQEVRRIQNDIINNYEHDFSKHAPNNEVPRILMVWHSILSQLSKENRKFIYGALKEGARAKEFEVAIQWLIDAGLIYKISRVKKGELPLSAFEDISSFKLFMVDTGLMCAIAKLSAQTLVDGNTLLLSAKGALTEQYVCQQLVGKRDISITYWSAENSRGELDFLIQHNDNIIALEVKAEENLRSKSLKSFIDKNPNVKGVRLSMSDYREQDWLTNYPLYSLPYLWT